MLPTHWARSAGRAAIEIKLTQTDPQRQSLPVAAGATFAPAMLQSQRMRLPLGRKVGVLEPLRWLRSVLRTARVDSPPDQEGRLKRLRKALGTVLAAPAIESRLRDRRFDGHGSGIAASRTMTGLGGIPSVAVRQTNGKFSARSLPLKI
jgi:hypothetical protein